MGMVTYQWNARQLESANPVKTALEGSVFPYPLVEDAHPLQKSGDLSLSHNSASKKLHVMWAISLSQTPFQREY
jgi:hypothetical protein